MSLKVWLPLNGNLNNYGTSHYMLNMFRGTETYNDNGKIGKCFYANGVNTLKISNILPDIYNYSAYSLCAWCYVEAQNTSHTGSAIISGGNWNSQLLNLSLSDWSSDHYTKLRISGTNWNRTYNYNFYKNTWYHIVVCDDRVHTYGYVNGVLIGDTAASFLPTSIEGNDICIGGATYYSGMQFFGKINDVRIYDHCLSALEVKKISQGLILHYKLNSDGTLCKTNLINWSKEGGVTSAIQSDGSVKIDCTAKTSSRWGIYCDIQNILPNTAYTFTVECKTANSAKPFQLSVGTNPVPSGTSQFGTNRATMNSPNGFTQYTATVVTKADTTWIRFYLACSCNSTNPEYQYAFVKNVNMTMGSTINTIIHDNSGYNHNGTIIGSMTMQAESPRYSACAVFNGTDTKIKVPNLTPAELTISFWMKRNANTNTRQFMYTAWNGITCELQTGGAPTFAVYRASYPTIVGDAITTTSGWVHYCATFDLVNGSKLYQNGILKSTNSNVTPIVYNITTNYIGYYNTYYNGAMSDFRIYCTALSAEDVKKLYETSMEIDSNGNILPRMLEQ